MGRYLFSWYFTFTMVLPTHVAKHNGEQCTAYSSRKHYRCPFKIYENQVCPKHCHYYEDWWRTHRPVIGWRSTDRNIREDYLSGFRYAGPPDQQYIDDLIDNLIYFDYWIALCLSFPEICIFEKKPQILYYTMYEYSKGRVVLHHEEWRRFLEKPDGGVRESTAQGVWDMSCRVFFQNFTAIYRRLMGWWGEHSPEEIAQGIQIQFQTDFPFLEKIIDMFEKVAPWYFLSGNMDVGMDRILEKYIAEFLKECKGEFYEVEGQKYMDRIRQKIYDTKQKILLDWKESRGIKSEFFEELVSTVWHPSRVGPWIETHGIEILETF